MKNCLHSGFLDIFLLVFKSASASVDRCVNIDDALSLFAKCHLCTRHLRASTKVPTGNSLAAMSAGFIDSSICLWAISNEIVAEIEISFKEKDTKYLEFLFYTRFYLEFHNNVAR
ncbi:hypothetical protein G4B88_002401 [Cannabis sativa]|uniref:Ycf2 N-terminal domain-containing protein n=1 Tax=Cannabis sativa TaxID=3483 RepID=A0A7J6I916_CANSA|nr:hypothetical protein G4B88_002401 [Cannabis sativa]